MRTRLLAACAAAEVTVADRATYGVTQGPRLETAAEIARMERDGCDLVGMTGMPEAALARELGLCYAPLAFVVNWAAGKGPGPIRMEEVEAYITDCMQRVPSILAALVRLAPDAAWRASGRGAHPSDPMPVTEATRKT
jgi:5'-methylthioadenosine phosphorylase/5'-methylthioinosine phosphorylase